jgi:hypothetical protein
MSESETQTQSETIQTQIEPQELTPEKIKELYEKAEKEGRIESRYILKLQTWYRQGESFEDNAAFDVIYGDAETVELGEWNEGYPYRKGHTWLIIPKSMPVVILWTNKYDYGTEFGEVTNAFIFTSEGWKKILVHSTKRAIHNL